MTLNTPQKLFVDQLRDLRSVEAQLEPAMAELVFAAGSPELEDLLRRHRDETRVQSERLKMILERHEDTPVNDRSEAMAGLIEGGNEHLAMAEDDVVRDMLLIAHCGRIEAYEIAAYRFAVALADFLELGEESELLGDSLAEEIKMAEALARHDVDGFSVDKALREQGVARGV
jgi:ferritin-like metal-binding protein YciE